MSYDQQLTMRTGEQVVLFGEFVAATGSGTLQSGSTFTLRDKYGTVVTGFNAVTVTGYDPLAGASGKVWYTFDSAGLTCDIYYVIFKYSVSGSDSLVRKEKPDFQLVILPEVELIATYDPNTVRGQTRKWLRDIDTGGLPSIPGTAVGLANPIWSDTEVDNMLLQAGYPGTGLDIAATTDGFNVTNTTIISVLLAAVIGWELVAADAAKVAVIERIAIFVDNTVSTYQSILGEAEHIRQLARNETSALATTPDTFYHLTIDTSSPSTTFVTGDSSLQVW